MGWEVPLKSTSTGRWRLKQDWTEMTQTVVLASGPYCGPTRVELWSENGSSESFK